MKELIINGVTVDLDDKTKIDLQFVSFLFTSINSISAPRSWTVSLPKSSKNLGLIQGASSSDYSGDFPYNNYVVDYYNKGFRLINSGKGILTKIGSRIDFVFTFGKAFEKIKLMSETKLRELPEEFDDILEWNNSISLNDMTNGIGWCNFYSYTNEDRSFTTHPDMPFAVLHPTVQFDYIMNKLASFFNLTFVGLSALVGGCSFPLNEVEGISKIENPTRLSSMAKVVSMNTVVGDGYLIKFTAIEPTELLTFNLVGSDIVSFKATRAQTIRVVFTLETNNSLGPDNRLELYWTNPSGANGNVNIDNSSLSGAYEKYVIDHTFTLEKDGTFSFRNTELRTKRVGFDYYLGNLVSPNRLDITLAYTGYGSNFPIIPNLPDMTCADFIFQAMQLAGVFPEVTDDAPDTINFYSADTIIDNIPNAKDWTNKLVKSTKRMSELSDVEFKFGNYAKKNTLEYKKDKTNQLLTDDYLVVENENLEDENKLVELKFAAGKRFSVSEKTIDYPLYDVKVQSGVLIRNPKSQSNDVLGKIVNIEGINYLQFTDDLLWSNIKLTDNYAAQQTLLNKPRYIKENFYLKPEDVYNFSTKIPIYLQQYGKYYAVMKLQYRESEFSEAELLELKNV